MSKLHEKPVLWTVPALEELEQITAYHMARGEASVARTIMQRVLAGAEKLGEWSAMTRQGRVAGTRELVVRGMSYIIINREKRMV